MPDTPKEPKALELADLHKLMEEASGEPLVLVGQLLEKLGASSDLSQQSDEDLARTTDVTAKHRAAYVLSLFRICEYLRNPVPLDKKDSQARLALTFLKHMEDSGLKAAQWGRGRGDANLAAEVAAMRAEMVRLADLKAKALLPEKSNGKTVKA